MVVDVRHRVEFESGPTIIPGALHLMIEELEALPQEVPRDRDIVLYCTCCTIAATRRSAWQTHRTRPCGSIGHGQADPVSCRR